MMKYKKYAKIVEIEKIILCNILLGETSYLKIYLLMI